MIWYIFYPFRGTTEPPRLRPDHPIRAAFRFYGTATARHWRISIFLSIVVSVLLCYPAVFQTDGPAATGLRNLPKHVWTSMAEVDGGRPADVEVRQVWVHGDYMKAIDPRVLSQALLVQNALIGRGFGEEATDAPVTDHTSITSGHGACYATERSCKWGYHSPLLYWNSSLDAIEQDVDLLATINSQSTHQSALNLTLRPSTVFAGKSFSNQRLRAADALVITLFDQTNSSLGYTWEVRSRQLAEELSPQWSLFPEDGQITTSRLYEFHFKPMTIYDDLLLTISYVITVAYVIWRMLQLRAVKSRAGLLVTVCVKMTICLLGSFTICAYLGIDLTRIPRPWFPGVIFCFGLGNIFRLIDMVLRTPPEMPPFHRVGTAIGEVGHLSLAVAVQNLVLLYTLSRCVTPLVADFCVFVAVTLVLDFVYHLTFFLAVLSVDVMRLELQDSIREVDLIQTLSASPNQPPTRQSWLAALRQGRVPLTARFAGPAAMLSIILALNWHYFDGSAEPFTFTPRGLLHRFVARAPALSIWSPPPINQARTPADWLRVQDHNTAQELFGFIKPDAHSFIARVYDPLLVVLIGASGRDTSEKQWSIREILRHFAREHAFPAAMIVVSLIAAFTLLVNYMFWTGDPTVFIGDDEDDQVLAVKTLPRRQDLDVDHLVSCPQGHLASIDSVGSILLWLYEPNRGYSCASFSVANRTPRLWPMVACAMDDKGTMMAVCAGNGQIGIWSFHAGEFVSFPLVEIRRQVPLLFSLISLRHTSRVNPSIVIVTSDGYLTVVETISGVYQTRQISVTSIISTALYTSSVGLSSLVYVTSLGEVYILALAEGDVWMSELVAGLDPGPPPDSSPSKINSIYPSSSLGLIFAIRPGQIEVFDFFSRALIFNIPVGRVKSGTFRVMHSARRSCSCGGPAVQNLALAYNELDTNHMVMHVLAPGEDAGAFICLAKPSENETNVCGGLGHARQEIHYVEPPGAWEATSSSGIIGIRKCDLSPTPTSTASGVDAGHYTAEPGTLSSALKQRATWEGKLDKVKIPFADASGIRHVPGSNSGSDGWEVWTLSLSGEYRCKALESEQDDSDIDPSYLPEVLLAPAPSAIVKYGKKGIVVALGNDVKAITLGKESFDGITTNGSGSVVDYYNWTARRAAERRSQ